MFNMFPSRPYTWVRMGVTLTLAFHVLYAIWLLLPLPKHVLQLGDDALETLGALLGTLFCFCGGAWKLGGTVQTRRVSLFCGLGILCYALQQIYIIYPDFAHHAAPVSRLAADVISLSSYPFLLLGIWQLPRKPLSLSSHLRISLDGLMIITAALTFSWYYIMGPALLAGHQALEGKIVSIAYPLADLLLIVCLLLLGDGAKKLRPVVSLFSAGLLCVVASDSVFSYRLLHGLWHNGTLLDLGWSLGFMPIGVAAAAARLAPDIAAAENEPERAPALWKSLLPYALLPCVAFLTLYTQHAPGRALLRHGVLWGGLVLVGLILARQVLAILENRELNGRLEALATTDPLTGLVNHRIFHKRLAEEVERAHLAGGIVAVAMMDLDNFKFFNDAYGHNVGDDVLRQVAHALRGCARSFDTVARFGGDEFALVLPQGQAGPECVSAESLRAEISERLANLSYLPPGSETAIPLTVTLGVALFPRDSETHLKVLEIADARLRRSKTGAADRPVDYLCRDLAHSVAGFSMLNALVTAVDNKDRYTRRHSEDVLAYSLLIAEQMGLDAATQHTLQVAALLHDVGKIGVPDAVLRKPGKLTEEEYQAIQQHPMMGAVIVGAVPGFEEALDVVRHHHERWDGRGYPYGLRADETPFLARLIAVADAFSAMTTDRPYRKGMGREKALSVLEAGAGTQWDPECVQALLRAYSPAALALAA